MKYVAKRAPIGDLAAELQDRFGCSEDEAWAFLAAAIRDRALRPSVDGQLRKPDELVLAEIDRERSVVPIYLYGIEDHDGVAAAVRFTGAPKLLTLDRSEFAELCRRWEELHPVPAPRELIELCERLDEEEIPAAPAAPDVAAALDLKPVRARVSYETLQRWLKDYIREHQAAGTAPTRDQMEKAARTAFKDKSIGVDGRRFLRQLKNKLAPEWSKSGPKNSGNRILAK